MARHTCEHVKQIRPVTPNSEGCEECLAAGDSWVHLRLCMWGEGWEGGLGTR